MREKLNVRICDLTLGETAMRKFVILACLTAPAAPVLAEGFAPRPDSCELIATMQKSNCEVENTYRCHAADGVFYRVEYFEELGLSQLGRMTAEFAPESSVDEVGDGMYFNPSNAVPPMEMIHLGTSVQNLDGLISLFGLKQPISGTATYTATGKTVELAGKTFETLDGEMSISMPNAGLVITGRTVIAYQNDIDLLLEIETSLDFGNHETSHTVEVALRGQTGFGDETPRHGCMSLSTLQVTGEGTAA